MKKILKSILSTQEFKNSSWSVFEILVLPILMLLVTPFFLRKLGAETYGQWILINSIIASLGILNLGLGDATIRFIAKYRFEDPQKAIRVANTTYTFYLILALIGFILAFGYLEIEKQFHLFLSRENNPFVVLLEFGISLFGIRLVEQIVFSIFKGFERFDLFSKMSICSKIILITSNVIVILLGYSLNLVLLISIVSSLLFLGVEFWFLKKFLPGFSLMPQFDKLIFSEIAKFGLWSWVQSIIGILGYQMDKLLVAYLAGVGILAYYSIGFTVASQIFNVFVATSNWLFPKVSRNNLTLKSLVALYQKSQFTLIACSSIIIVIFYFIKDPFINLWLGNDIYRKALPYINAYCLYILFTALTIVPSFFTLGTSSMKLMTINSVFSLTVTGILMYIMFKGFGPVGLVYGRTLSGIITIPIFLLLFYKFVLDGTFKYIFHELAIAGAFAVVIFSDYPLIRVAALLMATFIIIRTARKTLFKLKEVNTEI